ncbi:MAG: hypothetical protein R6V56_03720, partial [Lentisphaeria bacterium]
PPQGASFPAKSKPNFYSSSPSIIRQAGNFTEAEVAAIMEAKQKHYADRENINLFLAADIMGRLRSNFSFTESGIVTIEAIAHSQAGDISRRLTITRDCRQIRDNVHGHKIFRNWQKVFR